MFTKKKQNKNKNNTPVKKGTAKKLTSNCDADNAFNRINRQAALHNINVLCPSFNSILQNTYGMPIRLFITGEGELSSTPRVTV